MLPAPLFWCFAWVASCGCAVRPGAPHKHDGRPVGLRRVVLDVDEISRQNPCVVITGVTPPPPHALRLCFRALVGRVRLGDKWNGARLAVREWERSPCCTVATCTLDLGSWSVISNREILSRPRHALELMAESPASLPRSRESALGAALALITGGGTRLSVLPSAASNSQPRPPFEVVPNWCGGIPCSGVELRAAPRCTVKTEGARWCAAE